MGQYNSTPISQLVPGAQVLATDVYPAVDVTDLTQSPSGSTKKYTVAQLRSFLANSFENQNVYCASTANLTASYNNGEAGIGATLQNTGALGALVIDGVTTTVGMRVLVAYQTDATQNGIYVVTVVGDGGTPWVMTRAADFDNSFIQIMQGYYTASLFGNTYPLTWWFLVSDTPIVFGTTAITFEFQTSPIQLPWINQASTPATLVPNTGYTTNNGATQVVYTLPTTCVHGAIIQIAGYSAGGYTIAQNAGQQIIMGTTATTTGTGGSLTPVHYQYGCVLTCLIPNTVFQVTSSTGPFTIV